MIDFNRRTFLAGLATAPVAAAEAVAKDVVIPLTLERNQLWAPVRIEDQGPYKFLITLAADTHQIARDLARQLRLEPIAEGDVGGGARRRATYLYKAKKLELGGVITQRNSLLVGVVRGGPLLDGAFVPAFRRHSVGYDFERGQLTLRPGAPGVEGFTAIPMLPWDPKAPNDRRVRVRGEIDGRPAVFFIDSGGDESVLLLPEFVKRQGLWGAYPKSIEAVGQGVAGPFAKREVRFSRLRLGDLVIEAPSGGMIDPAVEFGATGDGVIGIDLLKRYHVWADLDGGMLYLKRNGLPAEPLRYNRSGVVLTGADELTVASVAAGSPGDKAGVRGGDGVILEPGEGAREDLRWRLAAPPGTVVELKLLRAGEAVPVSLTLEELI